VIGIWEVAIKFHRDRRFLDVHPRVLRDELLRHGCRELPLTGAHALAALTLPPAHKDPIDRILVAQALIENITLLTTDARLAQYPGPIQAV